MHEPKFHLLFVFAVLMTFLEGGWGVSTPCARLKQEKGLDCAACLPDLPAQQQECTRTAAEDIADEAANTAGGAGPRRLWNATSFLWNEDIRTFEFSMTKANWKYLVDDPAKEEYVEASIRVAGLGEWRGVGIRFKGFYGSLRICLTGGLNQKCRKLSYKVKFNFKNETQRFFGLKTIQFHASIHDPSLMRERLAYSLWRESGVAAPRSVHAVLNLVLDEGIAGKTAIHERLGVHLLTEVLDGRFTDAHFVGGDGNLYKEAWPGLPKEIAHDAYVRALQTNEAAANTTRLEAFGAALGAAKDDYALVEVFRTFTATDYWARYWAVDRAIEHWDGPLNFRFGDKGLWNHNFMLYEEGDKAGGKFRIVAWDVDGTIPDDRDATYGPRPAWDAPVCGGPAPAAGCIKCDPFDMPTGKQLPPSCVKSIRVIARGLRSEYVAAAKRLLEGPLQPCRLEAKLRRWFNSVRPHVLADAAVGVYPSIDYGFTWNYDEAAFQYFLDKSFPYILNFAQSVSCAALPAGFAEGWAEPEERPLQEMLNLQEWVLGSIGWAIPRNNGTAPAAPAAPAAPKTSSAAIITAGSRSSVMITGLLAAGVVALIVAS